MVQRRAGGKRGASMRWFWMILAALAATPAVAAPRAGDRFEIVRTVETSQRTGEDSSGSSYGRDTLIERVVAVRSDGVELEYDLPADATPDVRAAQWQFPVRLLKPAGGPPQLLNRAALEQRSQAWLRAAGLDADACGHWAFTWTAMRIDCDPQSALDIVAGFDPGTDDPREGLLFTLPGALQAAPLMRSASSAAGETFTVALAIDPQAVRRQEAETKVVLGEITQRPVTLESALQAQADLEVSGSIEVTFDTDRAGDVRRRVVVTRLRLERPGSPPEIRISTETLERRPVTARGG